MENKNLCLVLIGYEAKTAELEKKIEGFEGLAKVLSMEVDRQREKIESMKMKGKVLKFNHLRKVA